MLVPPEAVRYKEHVFAKQVHEFVHRRVRLKNLGAYAHLNEKEGYVERTTRWSDGRDHLIVKLEDGNEVRVANSINYEEIAPDELEELPAFDVDVPARVPKDAHAAAAATADSSWWAALLGPQAARQLLDLHAALETRREVHEKAPTAIYALPQRLVAQALKASEKADALAQLKRLKEARAIKSHQLGLAKVRTRRATSMCTMCACP